MKKLLSIILMCYVALASYCQSGNVYISVAMPNDCFLENNAKTILKNKLVTMASANGVSATECSSIAFVPEISIQQDNKVEGGMRTIYTRTLSITVTVRNVITNTIFGSFQVTCDGDGYSIADANRAAINRINLQGGHYNTFVEDTKRRIVDFYDKNTSTLVNKAKTLAVQEEYDEALALLSTYPESLKGYTVVAATMKNIFQQSQSKYCKEIMLAARAAYAQRDFEGASEIAASINSQSSCSAEAKQLLAQIKRTNDKEYNDRMAFEREQYRSQVALEREQIRANERMHSATMNAARDIAKSYYRRQRTFVYYW